MTLSKKSRKTKFDLEVVNQRLVSLEAEVDEVKVDLTEQKSAVKRLHDQVTSHERRGEERHQQILLAIQDMRLDFRSVLQQQAEESKSMLSTQTKLLVALGISSVLGATLWSWL
jgi:CHASE3 domain sensor protein